MGKKESRDDFVPDLSSDEEKDWGYLQSYPIDPDILKFDKEKEVDIFRSGNGSTSNLVRAETKNKTFVVNSTASTSGWRARLRGGKVQHEK